MTVDLDRWVQVLEPQNERGKQYRLSELDSKSRLVLLGEPGIGKTTALERLAHQAGTQLVTVRQLLREPIAPYARSSLFIDALDQARSRDVASDRVDALAAAMRDSQVSRWRLSCRSEDWRGRADLQAVAADEEAPDLSVVQLMPLQREEAIMILGALGHETPESFLDRAEANGVAAFSQSPLMLELLFRVVGKNAVWPQSRFDLYDQATARLIAEVNEEREHLPRADASILLDAASKLSLLLLTTGAEGVWRSNRAVPIGDDGRYITRDNSDIDNSVLDNVLDSALFRGDGRVFEPVHRTIAEFLAGRALAKCVVGEDGRSAYPLSRALALIADAEGKAPTELRGVHAWLTVHLARLGNTLGAQTLVEADPVSALFYGDAASLDTAVRRALLYALPSADPYFRSQARGDTAIGALSGEDLASEFRAILVDDARQDHLVITVLNALTGGVPVPSLCDVLLQIALDEARHIAHRSGAIDALINASEDPEALTRQLFDALSVQPPCHDREELRTSLFAGSAELVRDAGAICDILTTSGSLGRDELLSRLYPLQVKLQHTPRPDVLDELATYESLPWAETYGGYDIESTLTGLFVSAVGNQLGLQPGHLLRWINVLTLGDHRHLSTEATQAVQQWLDYQPDRDIALFEAIRSGIGNDSAWIANRYSATCERSVSPQIIGHLVREADPGEESGAVSTRITVAVDILTYWLTVPLLEAYWHVYALLDGKAEYREQFERLTVCRIEDWRQARINRLREDQRRKNTLRRWRIRQLSRDMSSLRDGSRLAEVHNAALRYFGVDSGEQGIIGSAALHRFYGEELSAAIVERWCTLAQHGLDHTGPNDIGTAAAEGQHFLAELPAFAGAHWLLDQGELSELHNLPLTTPLCVLTQGYYLQNLSARERLKRKALEALSASADGRDALFDFWSAGLDAGAKSILGSDVVRDNEQFKSQLAVRVESLLSNRPDLPAQVLREALGMLTGILEPSRFAELAEAALANSLTSEARGVWLALGIEIDPARVEGHLSTTTDLQILTLALADFSMGNYRHALVRDEPTSRTERYALAIQYLGPHVQPSDGLNDGVVTEVVQRHDVVNKGMNVLQSDGSVETASRIAGLLERGDLAHWHSHLRHVQSAQAAKRRDDGFRRPTAAAVTAALSGGPPLNANDLRAIVVESLIAQSRSLHTDDTTSWKQFWNTDPHGRAVDPRNENTCRDRILERLGDQLRSYRITAALPEAARGDGSRVDMLVISSSGANLPIEVKRHYHADVWSAASRQLQQYTSAPGADGLGVLLVLWFGTSQFRTPRHPDRAPAPRSADELASMLHKVLPMHLKSTTSIIVFDVAPTK